MIASRRACPICGENMGLVECTERFDSYKWECRKQANNKRYISTVIWGAVCKKNYLEQICDIFSYLEIIKTARKFIYK